MDIAQAGLDPEEFAGSAARAVAACAALDPAARAARLAEDGLLGVIAEEAVGGLGLGLRFALPVAQAAGAGHLAFPLIEALLLARHLAGVAPDVAAAIAAGEARGTIAWAGALRGELTGTVGRAPMAEGADWVLVRQGEGAALIAGADAAARPAVTLDDTVPEHTVTLDGAAAACRLGPEAWSELLDDALLLRAALILGAAEASLALAVEHVTNRRQFGRPLVAFQALRHLLARHKLAVEGIRGCLTRAVSLPAGEAARVARQAAFLAAATHGPLVAEGAIQAHGGMGFTWEVPVHRHLRRIRAIEAQSEPQPLRDAVAAALIDAN